MVNGAALRPGDAVTVLPAGLTSTISRISTADGDSSSAVGLSVAVELTDDLDVSRGDLLASVDDHRWSRRRSKRRSAGSVSGPQGRRALQDQHTTRSTPHGSPPSRRAST